MSDTKNDNTRRDFIRTSGAAAGAAALASLVGETEVANAHEINAMAPTPEQIQGFLSMDHDGPIVMVNLLKFKPDGGAAEYAKYSAGVRPILKKLGARIVFSGEAKHCLLGNADWDAVALVEYPTKQTLIQMTQSAEYQAIHHHRAAGLEGQVNYAVAQNATPGAES